MSGKLSKITIDKIKEMVDVRLLLDRYGVDYRNYGSDAYRCACPIHGGDNPTSFVFYNSGKNYMCFSRECAGDVIQFIKEMEKCDFQKALGVLADLAGVDIDLEKFQDQNSTAFRFENFVNIVGKSMDNLRKKTGDTNKTLDDKIKNKYLTYVPSSKYLNRWRSIDYTLQKDFEVGFGILPNDPCKTMRIIVPIYDEYDKLIGLQGRAWKKEIEEKYCYYPTRLKKSHIVFNMNRIKSLSMTKEDSIFVTEGIFDVMNLWKYDIKSGVALFGSKPSDEQMDILTKYSKNFMLCFDNDIAGIKATRIFLKKISGLDVNVLIFPIIENKNDVGEMTLEEIEESLSNVMTPKIWLEMHKT